LNRFAEAESEFKKAEEISPGSVTSLGALAYAYGLEGKKWEAERMLPEVKALSMRRSPFDGFAGLCGVVPEGASDPVARESVLTERLLSGTPALRCEVSGPGA
jgi:hypothetical protein